MDITFYKSDESHDVIEFAFSSPEECQQYSKALAPEIPEGMYRDLRRGVKNNQPTLTLGVAKIGERLKLPSEKDQPVQQAPVPKAVEIPQVVKDADDEHLEVMAVRNGVPNIEGWRKRNRSFREAAVAKAMQTTNAR